MVANDVQDSETLADAVYRLFPGFKASTQEVLGPLVFDDGRLQPIDLGLPHPDLPTPEHLIQAHPAHEISVLNKGRPFLFLFVMMIDPPSEVTIQGTPGLQVIIKFTDARRFHIFFV